MFIEYCFVAQFFRDIQGLVNAVTDDQIVLIFIFHC